jgi:hypothetical protein
LSLDGASCSGICFWKETNTIVVFPFASHIAVQQSFRPSGHTYCCTTINHLEHKLAVLQVATHIGAAGIKGICVRVAFF